MEKGVFELRWAATIKPRMIEYSVFFYWTTTDKLEFTDWSEVNQMFGCGWIAIFRQRMMIWKMCPWTSLNLQNLTVTARLLCFWHKRSALQSVGVWAVYWQWHYFLFFQTPSAILDFAGGVACRQCGVAGVAGSVALQAVQCGVAGGERLPPAPLGWYFSTGPQQTNSNLHTVWGPTEGWFRINSVWHRFILPLRPPFRMVKNDFFEVTQIKF